MFAAARGRRHAGTAVAGIALGAALWLVLAFPQLRPGGLLRDFNAFYCAGSALALGKDPYLAESLDACEHLPKAPIFLAPPAGLIAPAPLPPYALVPFVALARLAYDRAALVWSLLLFGSVVVAIVALRRATGLATPALVAAFALTDGYAALCLGQLAPTAVAALALAALMLANGRERSAALAASLAMLEPHVGLPACIGLFISRPGTRLTFVLAGLALAATSLAVAGQTTSLEYLRAVLPAHALSEVANEKQLSLSYLLGRFGWSAQNAVYAGEADYLVMLALGIGVSRALARSLKRPALLVALPPAFTLLGGPFIHISQIAAALPGALVLFEAARGRTRAVFGGALVLLAVPWIQFSNLGTVFVLLAPLAVAALTAAFLSRRPLVVSAAAAASVLFLWLVESALAPGVDGLTAGLSAHSDPRALAEIPWGRYVARIGEANATAFDLAKLPTVAGLLGLLGCATARGLSARAGNATEGGTARSGPAPMWRNTYKPLSHLRTHLPKTEENRP